LLPHKREGTIAKSICRDCFDSGMILIFLEKATHSKMKGQEDKLNIEKKRKKLEAAGKRKCQKL
jgi:hypothetical protein